MSFMTEKEAIDKVIELRRMGNLKHTPNVAVIDFMGFSIVVNSIPRDVRKEIMTAVKDGILVHIKKTKSSPEAFSRPQAVWACKDALAKHQSNLIEALKKVFAS